MLNVYPRVFDFVASPIGMLSKPTWFRNLEADEVSVSVAIVMKLPIDCIDWQPEGDGREDVRLRKAIA